MTTCNCNLPNITQDDDLNNILKNDRNRKWPSFCDYLPKILRVLKYRNLYIYLIDIEIHKYEELYNNRKVAIKFYGKRLH